jgi:putative hydrolase of the HAD superfamily
MRHAKYRARHTKIAAVIFDYGRVLAQTLDPTPRALWEHQLGLAPGALTQVVHNEQSWIAAQRGDITAAAHWQAIGDTLRLTPVETTALRAAFYRGDVLNIELVACLDALRSTGLRLGLLSNFSTDLRALLVQQGLLRRFDHIAISAEIGAMKPDTAAYTAILNMLALPADACIFIDDQPVNVAAAQALGIHGIVFRDNASCLAELNDLLTATTC